MLNPKQFKPLYTSDYGSARVSPEGYVSNVVISLDHRGQGHGTDLMRQITNDADRLGLPLQLNARRELHGWYGRLGFEQTGEKDFGQPRLSRKPLTE